MKGGLDLFASKFWWGKGWEEGFSKGGGNGRSCVPFREAIFFRCIIFFWWREVMVLQE